MSVKKKEACSPAGKTTPRTDNGVTTLEKGCVNRSFFSTKGNDAFETKIDPLKAAETFNLSALLLVSNGHHRFNDTHLVDKLR